MTRHFRYIRFSLLEKAIAAGWMPTTALQGCHHGEYSVLCEWICSCPEAWPL